MGNNSFEIEVLLYNICYMDAGVYISEHVILPDEFLLYLQSSGIWRERGRRATPESRCHRDTKEHSISKDLQDVIQ